MPPQNYAREKNGIRLDLMGGMDTMLPADLMQQAYPYLQNVRRNLAGRAISRPPLGSNVLPSTITAPTSMILMNDPYMVSPPALTLNTYVLLLGANGLLYLYNALTLTVTQLVHGLSGLPLSFIVFGPNTTPQPWCYVADPSLSITIPNGGFPGQGYPPTIYGNPVAGMVKVRSDNLVYKTGIAEPQVPPTVSLVTGPGPNWTIYRYVYRSSITGALSNPSPESPAQVAAQGTDAAGPIDATAAGVTYNASQYEPNPSDASSLRTAGGVGAGVLTDYIIVTGFGLGVPSNVPIQGVEVTINWYGQEAGTGLLFNVSLYYEGNQFGIVKSPGVSNTMWPTTPATPVPVTTVGSSIDSWGAALSSEVLNDPTFGFGVQIEAVVANSSNRSFIDSFTITVYYANQDATVLATGSPDPQVDKIDFYRSSPGLENFTYVGTILNSAATSGLADTLSDLAVAANPILEFDNYEPFPSIDLPHSGTVTVGANGVLTVTGGNPFNVRWLPGNLILLGSPGSAQQTAWTTYARPTSTTSVQVYQSIIDPTTGIPSFNFPPTGANQTYEISEATLAAEPSPVIWGPTPENQGAFYFGLDPLNPGDLVWSKGNNFDSAPDTNRQIVTSPSEILMNGTITSELSTVFSTERFWLIYPNFSDAVAIVTGTEGAQWNLIQAQATRGLYMRYAIACLGSMIAYRAKDCIAVSMGGGPEEDVTASIYNLFPHGGSIPQPVVIAGNTVFPPDDTKPNAQTLTLTPSYLFYNYQDTTGTARTLVYDIQAKGWSVDAYVPTANCHLWTVGSPSRLLLGCTDGTVRLLGGGGGAEFSEAIICTRSENGGDARALKRVGDVFFRAEILGAFPVSLQLWKTQLTSQLTGFSPTILGTGGTGAIAYYTVDFTSGGGDDVDNIGAVFSWALGSNNILDLWQPSWTELPEIIQDRPSDWTECGIIGNKLIRGMIIEMDTFDVPKTIQVENSDNQALVLPNQSPVTANGQTLVPFTFDPPFTSHMLRIVSLDGVPWRMWGVDAQWICDAWPDYTPLYSPWLNLGSDGAKYLRSLLIPMDTAGAAATFRVQTSDGNAVTFTATTQIAVKTPVPFAFIPPLVVHDVQLQCESNAGLWTDEVRWFFDSYPELIPARTPIMELSGPDNKFMQGIKIVADSANNFVGDVNGQPVQFQILFDGGQIGPTLESRIFNGKQTQVYSFNPPFNAHDLQLVPLQPVRIWLPGMGGDDSLGESSWVFQPSPDSATTWATEASSFGLYGWCFIYQINLAYISTTPVTLTVTTDQGVFTLSYPPSTAGPTVPSKVLMKCPRNKWKVVAFAATSTSAFSLWQELTEVWIRSWGETSEFHKINPFGGPSSPAATI
jgi:hypothetical protein